MGYKRNINVAILKRFFGYLKPIIDIIEKSKIRKYASEGERQQPIFIIGAPRTGSTILYQIITDIFDVLYTNNLIDILNKNFYFAFWLSSKLFHNKPHNCYTSYFGDTWHCGIMAPSECGSFWYRWLPDEKHFIRKNEISKKSVNEIRNNIFSVINKYNKPLLLKNINAGLRMEFISEIAPNAKFIFIKRNPLYTAQSILLVRKKIYNDESKWWSLMPKNYIELKDLDFCEQVVKQIYYIEKQIFEDSRLFPAKNFMKINYSEFCNNFYEIIDKLHSFIGRSVKKRDSVKKVELKFSETQYIDNITFNKIKNEVDKLDWINYLN